jgi:hypothetical protein
MTINSTGIDELHCTRPSEVRLNLPFRKCCILLLSQCLSDLTPTTQLSRCLPPDFIPRSGTTSTLLGTVYSRDDRTRGDLGGGETSSALNVRLATPAKEDICAGQPNAHLEMQFVGVWELPESEE